MKFPIRRGLQKLLTHAQGMVRPARGEIDAREGFKSAFEGLQSAAERFRQEAEGYRRAFETLQEDATRWHQEADGFRGAYEASCKELARTRDERDRALRSLEKRAARSPSTPHGPDGRQICFLHIGKTAGTSLQHALFEAMGDAPIFHDSPTNYDRASAVEIALNDLVIGHYAYQHVTKFRPDRFLLTFLRDPIDRVISNYYFLRKGSPIADFSGDAIKAAAEMSLSEFIRCEDPGVRMVTENFQAKALAYDFRPQYQDRIVDLQVEAERNLATFDFVGVVDHYEASVAALSRALGLKLAAKKLNVNEARPANRQIADEDRALLDQLNAVDHALYTRARKQFERDMAARPEAISA